MSTQWIWRIIYIIFIGAITFIVASFSEASKVVTFLADREDIFMEDDRALIQGTVIANNHDGTDTYILAEPLYKMLFESETQSIQISIYPLVEFKGSKAHNSMAILLNDIEINDDQAKKDDNDYHIIKAEISFDRNLSLGDGNKSMFIETMTPLYDDHGRMMVINQELLKTSTGQAAFEMITIHYEREDGINSTLINLSNGSLIDVIPNDVFDASYDRDIQALTDENLDILAQFGLSNLSQQDDIYYNDALLSELQSYNRFYFIYIAIEIAIVLPITYFLFFHKYIRRRLREKKLHSENN